MTLWQFSSINTTAGVTACCTLEWTLGTLSRPPQQNQTLAALCSSRDAIFFYYADFLEQVSPGHTAHWSHLGYVPASDLQGSPEKCNFQETEAHTLKGVVKREVSEPTHSICHLIRLVSAK